MEKKEYEELEELAKQFIINYEPLTEEEKDLLKKREMLGRWFSENNREIARLEAQNKRICRITNGIERRMEHLIYRKHYERR